MRLRIVRDKYAGYEVQVWRWWWPFWTEADFMNTHFSVERAEARANEYRNYFVVKQLK